MNYPLSDLSLTNLVLAAPMAGGPSTPACVTAAARAGSLGFLAAGYKTPQLLAEQIRAVRRAKPGPSPSRLSPRLRRPGSLPPQMSMRWPCKPVPLVGTPER